MGISDAFSISRSGLSTNAQWAELVSGNIANAENAAYGRRTLSLGTQSSGGVALTGVNREADASLTRMHREELGRLARQETTATGLAAYSAALGGVDSPSGPAQRLASLQASMDLLYNAPGDASVQRGTLQAAQSLASDLNRLSTDLGTASRETEKSLISSVADTNKALERVVELNRRLQMAPPGSARRTAVEDEMAGVLTGLAEQLDLRVTARDQGGFDLHTSGGARLVEDETVFEVAYVPGSGKLTAGDVDITPGSARGITEGRLAGKMDLLTETMPRMERQLDEYAANLMLAFESNDMSLAAGQAGLFTDEGLAHDPARLEGLAGRLAVNDAAVPEAGGALWRLRDGMGATAPGAAGSTLQIDAWLDATEAGQSFSTATGLDSGQTLAEFAAAMTADQHGYRARAEAEAESLSASAAAIDGARLNAQGVNIDDELQQLMLIEQSYAANSQVISTLAKMLDQLIAAV